MVKALYDGRLAVDIAGLKMATPVTTGSGTFGFGQDFAGLYDLNRLGSFSFKGTTLSPREGNPTPRIAECYAGMLNAVGTFESPLPDAELADQMSELAINALQVQA